ncbi:zinc-dependent metalloprotease [Thalassotalea sediminis]|uniref:zinc-dependent metalloprotease n=1 Tax=Thalassotalea sediminis TaxID=1759089 RepID=UPI00257288F2|nr:zinc-dependent metalloprotease [Thalassotalea sediminis]
MKTLKFVCLLLICSIFSVCATDSIEAFVKGKQQHQGFFTFYYDKESGKVYVEIEQQQEFLFQSAMPHGVGSNDIGLDRGQLGQTRLVAFERVGEKVLLRQKNTYYRANSNNKLEQKAVEEAFASAVIWGFKVVAEDNNRYLIDYTPFLLSDIHKLGAKLKARKQGSFSIDRSRSAFYAPRSKAFDKNTELEATVTFKGTGAGRHLKSVTPDDNVVTVNFHHSLIALPDEQYKTREFHPYSGFWAHKYADYASAIEEPLVKRVINRHRLEKKQPLASISEAKEPIIYYLDPGVPEPIKSALIEGAMWWNQAFEAIGYRNAFQVKMLPADADPMDVRFNVIQWVHRATRGWSYGSSVIDPRTGEIIKGHVTLGSLRVRQDYLIALGLTSPFSSKSVDTTPMKEMALARIRQLSAHEVGHTLGIAHNFAASTNDRASVMDYPHPYIQLKSGEIDLSQAYDVNIGSWDKHVIAYGYQDTGATNEQQYLAKVIADAQQKSLRYMSDADGRPKSGGHLYAHLWDNGNDPVDELIRVLAIRKKALSTFGIHSIPFGTPLAEIEQVLVPIYNFHRYQVEAAAKVVAGINYSYQVRTLNFNNTLKVVEGRKQQHAIEQLLLTLSPAVLTLPKHIVDIIPPKAYSYYRDRESFSSQTGLAFDPVTAAEASAKHTIDLLLNKSRLARLAQQSAIDSAIPSPAMLLKQLIEATIKQPAQSGLDLLVQQRVNRLVVNKLAQLWQQKQIATEVKSEVFVVLNELSQWLDARKTDSSALSGQYFLMSSQIPQYLAHKLNVPENTVAKLPPGSPIGQ